MMIDAMPTMAPNVDGKQVRALATTGKSRSSVLPDVPTAAEAGVPGYEATIWLGLMAPAGTPKPIIDKLNAAVNAAVKRPDIVKLWTEQGAVPMSMTPEEFDKYPARRHREMGRGGQEIRRQAAIGSASMPSRPLSPQWRRDVDRRRSRSSLLDILRERLGLTGPHFGCGAGECGACNVADRRSCCGRLRHAAVVGRGQGRRRRSEGLGNAERPHPLQRAFIAEQAMQCGYCVSGILISAAALLQRNPSPTSKPRLRPRSTAIFAAAARITASCGRCCAQRPKWLPMTEHALPATDCRSAWRQTQNCRPGCSSRRRATSTVSPGKVEIGQGIVTALAQIAADELDVDISPVQMVRASTAASPNEGVTSGSLSIQQSGRALRHVCAEVRQIFLARPSDRLGVNTGALNGRGWRDLRTRQCDDQLLGVCRRVSLDREATPGAVAKRGNPAQRWPDIRSSAWISPTRFSHIHASFTMSRCKACCTAGCCGPTPRRRTHGLEEDGARALAGLVAIVRDGNFAGVVSETELAQRRDQGAAQGATWSGGEALPDENGLASLPEIATVEPTIDRQADSHSEKRREARTIRRQYTRPYIAHASIAPSCAMAQWTAGPASMSGPHSQGVYFLRADLALVLKLPAENITVEHIEGAGCYGHNGADDVALDAVLLARAAGGRPVRVQWSREDEMSHAPFGAAMAIEIEADLEHKRRSSAGGIRSGATAMPRGRAGAAKPALLAATEIADPFPRMISTNPPQPMAAAAIAMPSRSTIFRPGPSRCHRLLRCRSAPRRCGRSAHKATCSRSNASLTKSPPSAARIRSTSACAICRTSGPRM